SVVAAPEARKQRLGVAPGAPIDGDIALREGNLCGLVLFDHGDGARREPSALCRRCQRSLRQTLAVGWVEEGQREAAGLACRPELRGVTAKQLGDARQPERLDVAARERTRPCVVLDEEAELGAS